MVSRSVMQLIILTVCIMVAIVVLTCYYLMSGYLIRSNRPPYHSDIDDINNGTTVTSAVLLNDNDGNVDTLLVQDHASEDPQIMSFAPWEEDIQNRLSSVYFSIKSTESHTFSRLPPSVLTWLRTVPSRNVYIVTDNKTNVTEAISRLGYNVKYIPCLPGHDRPGLLCKTGNEFRLYYEQVEAGKNFSWYCHLDDDMYVNTEQLGKLLLSRDHNSAHYIGQAFYHTKDVKQEAIKHYLNMKNKKSFRFACGAIYCISKKVMSEIEPYVRGEKLAETYIFVDKSDDAVVGFVIEAILGYHLTHIREMYTQYTISKRMMSIADLKRTITISYWLHGPKEALAGTHVIIPDAVFSFKDDPTRFFSYHCVLYPTVSWCQSRTLPKLLD